ncbi:expressed unknown protein [Seminavis robusta]|uniref:Fe2OG dioxygenase domain-containing protein n=1 Tax=Seminavis robusta TaxID=568900 RepID=A0A9N8HUH1_9STRA|nr:expressed unknown protein [Seminavis robusta]|eukprot:Sro1816_g299470.1 n/a (356) ;mRNA; r:12289-13963
MPRFHATIINATTLLISLIFSLIIHDVSGGGLSESYRLEEHDKRYSRQWPPEKYVPDTVGWKKLMDARLRQVAEIDDLDRRYEGYMQTITPAITTRNFTEFGFGLARGPEALSQALREGIRGGLERGEARLEHSVEVIEGPRCLFIDRPDLTRRVLDELQSYTEAWAGIPLTPAIAYGFRLYQNNSILNMHVDKPQTHVISMIYHIDSSDDAEPWPILIEDLHGNTHEVILTPGDVLFYESSKCLHGRPKIFNGSWYSSIFVHYYPTHGWQEVDHHMEGHFAIPAGWAAPMAPEEKVATPLVMLGTSFKEPSCPNAWCRGEETIKWSGPAKEGFWIAPNMELIPFEPTRVERDEL